MIFAPERVGGKNCYQQGAECWHVTDTLLWPEVKGYTPSFLLGSVILLELNRFLPAVHPLVCGQTILFGDFLAK